VTYCDIDPWSKDPVSLTNEYCNVVTFGVGYGKIWNAVTIEISHDDHFRICASRWANGCLRKCPITVAKEDGDITAVEVGNGK